jgi:glycosyltransferase involved in cell wall biosynthesis
MNKEQPLISVLMTAYNREKFIEESIDSVLRSTYTNFELIITDDCSSDTTFEIAKSYAEKDCRVKVYQNEVNLGDYPNRNKAASYAQGKYIKYLDSDDIIYPHCLMVMVSSMEKFSEAGYGLSCKGDSSQPYPICILPHDAYWEHFNGQNHFDRAPGSAIIKKSAFDKVGGFSGKRMIGDNEMWLTIGRYFPLVKFPIDLYWARTHASQESQSDYAKEYKRLRRMVFEEALADKDCPLNEIEKKAILLRIRTESIKHKILKYFR